MAAKGMLMSRVKAVALIALGLIVAVGGVSGVLAQDGVRVVPVHAYLPAYKLSPDGHTSAVFEVAAYHNNEPDADSLPIHVVDLDTGQEQWTLTGFTDFASDVAFTPDGSRLVSYHQNGYMLIWDLSTGQQIGTIPALPGSFRIVFAPDGVTLVAVGNSGLMGQIVTWNLDSRSITQVMMPRFEKYQDQMDLLSDPRQAARYGATAFVLSSDGTRLAVASMNQDIWLWDLGTGESTLVRQGVEGAEMRFGITQIAFTPDGNELMYLDTSGDTPAIFRLDLTSGTETTVTALDQIKIVAFAPDGTSLAWLDETSGTLNVASLDDPGKPASAQLASALTEGLYGMRNLRAPQAALIFVPDGQQVIMGGYLADSGENALVVIDRP